MDQQLFAFVLMPFSKKLKERYIRIKRAASEAGIRAERVDDQSFYRRGIVERIHNQIQVADFIIADMTAPNPNVYYEVGCAHAKGKLCILLTNDADTIPFDLRHLRHIVFFSMKDFRKQLLKALEAVKAETYLSFDRNDRGCLDDEIPVYTYNAVPSSKATSIRIRVQANVELQPTKVSVHLTRIEKFTHDTSWQDIKLPQPIQLTWADTDTILTDFTDEAAKYINVLHIDHNDNKISIWRLPPSSLVGFFNDASRYRLTVSALTSELDETDHIATTLAEINPSSLEFSEILVPHVHGIARMGNATIGEVRHFLQKVFPASWQVVVKGLHDDQATDKALSVWGSYSTKSEIKTKRGEHGKWFADMLSGQELMMVSMFQKALKYRGGRFSYHLQLPEVVGDDSTSGNMRIGCSGVVWCFVMDAAHSPATDFVIPTKQN
jgi:hypothetical protein